MQKTTDFLASTDVYAISLRSVKMLYDKILYFPSAVFCMAWWRLVVLINRDFVKKRSVDKQPVYELLPAGEALAKELKG